VPFDQLGFPDNLPKTAPIELTKGYLSSIPVIFTTFPAIFGLLYAASHHRDNEDGKDQSPDRHKEVK
jgi:hypothetical protein